MRCRLLYHEVLKTRTTNESSPNRSCENTCDWPINCCVTAQIFKIWGARENGNYCIISLQFALHNAVFVAIVVCWPISWIRGAEPIGPANTRYACNQATTSFGWTSCVSRRCFPGFGGLSLTQTLRCPLLMPQDSPRVSFCNC